MISSVKTKMYIAATVLLAVAVFAINTEADVGKYKIRGVYAGMPALEILELLKQDYPSSSELRKWPNTNSYTGDIKAISKCRVNSTKQGRNRCSAGFLLTNSELNGAVTWQDQIEFTALNGVAIDISFIQTTLAGNSEAACTAKLEQVVDHYEELYGDATLKNKSGSIVKLEWNDSESEETSYAEPEYEGLRLRLGCNNVYDTSAYTLNMTTQVKSGRAERSAREPVSSQTEIELKL